MSVNKLQMTDFNTKNPGTIYFVEEKDQLGFPTANYVKIGLIRSNTNGRTSDDRKDEHQTGNPRPLIVVESIDTTANVSTLESSIHQVLTMQRHRGEWFVKPNGEIAPFVEKAKSLQKELELIKDLEENLQQFSSIEDSGEEISKDSSASDIHKELSELTSKIQSIDEQKKLIEYKIRLLGGDYLSDIAGICGYKVSKPTNRFNTKLFQIDNPDLFEKYSNTEISSDFRLRKIPAKKKNDELSQLKQICDTQKCAADHIEPHSLNDSPKIEYKSRVITASAEAQNLHHDWLLLHTEREPLSLRKSHLIAKLKLICGEKTGIENICSWTRTNKPKLKKSDLIDVSDEMISRYTVVSTPTTKFIINPFRPYMF